MSGAKSIILQNHTTSYRGDLLIHAAQKIDRDQLRRLKITGKMTTGAIVGRARLHDVKEYHTASERNADSPLHMCGRGCTGRYGLILQEPKRLRVPIPYAGRPGLFEAKLQKAEIPRHILASEIIEEDYRYQWIGHH